VCLSHGNCREYPVIRANIEYILQNKIRHPAVIYKCCLQYCVSIVKWYWNNNVFLLIIIVYVSKYFSLSSFWLKNNNFSLVLFFAVVIAVTHRYKQNKTKTKKKKTKQKQNKTTSPVGSVLKPNRYIIERLVDSPKGMYMIDHLTVLLQVVH
jgi:hypothetical protein